MTDRNEPCPCGSGRKFKKCHGAGSAAAPGVGAPGAPKGAGPAPAAAVPAAHPSSPPSTDEKAFLVHTGRGLESERADAERKKHLRRRIQTSDLKGTLAYNSGAFFKPPNP
jgi:hypothetical protein